MESMEYAQTWGERREQFGRIVEEGMNLRRLIRDEKEEVERREGMEEGGEDEGDTGSKGKRSAVSTPRPDQEPQTPSQTGGEESNLTAPKIQTEKPRSGSTRAGTPLRQMSTVPQDAGGKQTPQEPDDENMVDEGEVTADEAGEILDVKPADKMDTT